MNKKVDKSINTNTAINKDIIELFKIVIGSIRELSKRTDKKINDIKLKKGEKGDSGSDYILTVADKKDIASLIKIPVVDRVIEKTQIIKEVPMVTETKIIEKPIINETVREIIPQNKIEEIEKKIEENLPKFGIAFRDALELLTGNERLDVSAIKGLQEELDKISSRPIHTPITGGGRGHIKTYDLSDKLDGLTTTFNLPANWGILSVSCSSFPSVLRPIIDYVGTSTQITFTSQINPVSTLASGQTLIVLYEEA